MLNIKQGSCGYQIQSILVWHDEVIKPRSTNNWNWTACHAKLSLKETILLQLTTFAHSAIHFYPILDGDIPTSIEHIENYRCTIAHIVWNFQDMFMNVITVICAILSKIQKHFLNILFAIPVFCGHTF